MSADAGAAGAATVTPVDTTSTGGPSGVQNPGAAAGPVVVPNNASPDWTAALPEAARHYVTQKGFKDPSAVIDSYQNLEKLMGAPKDRLLKLPEKMDSPEMNEIYDRLGRPKNANEYTFKTPEGSKADPEFTDFAQKLFHAQGLTKAQGETVAAKYNEFVQASVQKQNEAAVANLKVEETALKKEWGAAYDQQIKSCNKAAQTFGLGQAEVTKLEGALGYSATLKFLASIGSKLGEDNFIGDGQGQGFKGALTPDSARAELSALQKDNDFIRRYANGDREAMEKMTRLHQFAYPDLPQD